VGDVELTMPFPVEETEKESEHSSEKIINEGSLIYFLLTSGNVRHSSQ